MVKHKLHEERLRKAGWTKEEISHARRIFKKAEKKTSPGIAALDKWVFWLLLLVGVLGIVAFAIWILPVLFFLTTPLLVFILLIIGICFGTLFTVAIQDLHWLRHRHHGFAALLLPVASIVAFGIIVGFGERYRVAFPEIITYYHNPWLVGVIFAIGLLIPYIFHLLTEYRQRT